MSSWPAISPGRRVRAGDPIREEAPAARADAPATVVVFDVMDTLLHDPYREAHEAATGLAWETFDLLRPEEAYHALERSAIDEPTYWRTLREAGIRVDVERFHAVRRDGYAWLPGMRELLDDTVAKHRVVLASNYPAAWIDDVRATFFDGRRVEFCGSCQLGARKPGPRFFERIAGRLGLRPATTVLVDDVAANVRAAVAAGWMGVLHRDPRGTRAALDALGVRVGEA